MSENNEILKQLTDKPITTDKKTSKTDTITIINKIDRSLNTKQKAYKGMD